MHTHHYVREFVLTTIIMARARVGPEVGADLDDSISGNECNECNECP